ncbi:plasmid recombination protein [Vibrio parahaemolyticus]|uniref:Plasmid recombination protein n=2 Tax=Vibrio parahaemolyticus TaxID=670 RepID=A0AA46Z527_VIBPH|nr:plasmid recombination protein [Vibrio parahaemolyticus]UYV25852.1 plasmid recombination protein [Vibrio parahaemolyticus]
MRHPTAVPHIPDPKPPIILYGYTAYDALELAQARANISRDSMNRKIRRDARLVLSGVISCPLEFKTNSEVNYKKWINENLNYLHGKYGGNLISVILHEDEAHPHIHFICVPKPTVDSNMHIKMIHDPIKERENTKGGRKVKFDAYKRSFRKLQDEYYESVASKFGFLRDGARRNRLTRSEYIRRKEYSEALKNIYSINYLMVKTNQFKEKEVGSNEYEIKPNNSKVKSQEEIIKVNKRDDDMLCLFKKYYSINSKVELYKDKYEEINETLNKLKKKYNKVERLYFLFKEKYNRAESKVEFLEAKVKELELDNSIIRSQFRASNNSSHYVGDLIKTPREESLMNKRAIKIDVNKQERKEKTPEYTP